MSRLDAFLSAAIVTRDVLSPSCPAAISFVCVSVFASFMCVSQTTSTLSPSQRHGQRGLGPAFVPEELGCGTRRREEGGRGSEGIICLQSAPLMSLVSVLDKGV